MALDTVEQLLGRVRTLLQDKVEPYRYSELDLIAGLNEACMEAKRLRPDLFLRTFNTGTFPNYTAPTDTLEYIPEEYRTAFIYYITGNATLRDSEENSDERAAGLLNKFVSQMTTMPA